jgi:hypothetical protein
LDDTKPKRTQVYQFQLSNNMKKIMVALLASLVVLSGLVLANRETKTGETEKKVPKKAVQKPLSVAEQQAVLKRWQASPDGIQYKKWQESPAGIKVQASAAKIGKAVKDSANIEALVTSLSLPDGARLGFGVMVRIDGDDYILAFGPEPVDKKVKNDYVALHSLKVDDRIIIRSHSVSQAPKYAYPIVSGDYVEKDGNVLYKRAPRKGGC